MDLAPETANPRTSPGYNDYLVAYSFYAEIDSDNRFSNDRAIQRDR